MFKTKYYIVDAFTDIVFKGNPAGICVLENKLDDKVMQEIAAENNLSETAFILQQDDIYSLRWFTPKTEIDLCGHATLGSAYILMNFYNLIGNSVKFKTKSGILPVKRTGDLYELDFPARSIKSFVITNEMLKAVGVSVLEAYSFNNSKDLLLLVNSEAEVQNAKPNFELLKTLVNHAVTVTAKGDSVDFVSRFFAPNMGVNEDPVTGSSHTALIPFWSDRLSKKEMTARQLSKRGGYLYCENCSNSVKIAGKAKLYLQGDIFVNKV